MVWSEQEVRRLHLILDRIAHDLSHPLDAVVAGSGRGELTFELAQRFPHTRFVGFEIDAEALAESRRRAKELGIAWRVEFIGGERRAIPLPARRFGGFVDDVVLFPSRLRSDLDQGEVARVLKPGGVALLTDVVLERLLNPDARHELTKIGFDYCGTAEREDFRGSMTAAGFRGVTIEDLTPLVRPLWEARLAHDRDPAHRMAYSVLFDREVGLGNGIGYVYARGRKPRVAAARPALAGIASAV